MYNIIIYSNVPSRQLVENNSFTPKFIINEKIFVSVPWSIKTPGVLHPIITLLTVVSCN